MFGVDVALKALAGHQKQGELSRIGGLIMPCAGTLRLLGRPYAPSSRSDAEIRACAW
ncbi:hypothetical protein IHE31_10290 [Mycetohabitans rhizoxinica]|uniref:Transporter n=1 Tax=Mycetohabitans rhizoxinica (strain DSM 19002 / CIP 109453 / HKI 454) TaxID=882378 RepID=E5ARB4_MYCRK|nr:hypothetical protein [Mycetohabitans sp. B2]MCG1047214.1 hypothetical protein [Mycetohabitans sp. B6]CBW75146.1 Transporter [Mycetohabitans rhizoxinica HKI 454]